MYYEFINYRIIKKKTKTSWGWGFDGPTMDIYHIQGLPNRLIAKYLNRMKNKNWFYKIIYEHLWVTICNEGVTNNTGYFTDLEQAKNYFDNILVPNIRAYHKNKQLHKNNESILIYNKSGQKMVV